MHPHQTVLFHTRGLGPFDFPALDEASLPALGHLAASRKALLCPIVYLTADGFDAFEKLLVSYSPRKQCGVQYETPLAALWSESRRRINVPSWA